MDGYLLINKPSGPTSHDVCKIIKKLYQAKKVGHTGTLDPKAEGLMVILLGQATRLAEYIVSDDKEYIAGIRFGIETDTQDIWGEVLQETAPDFDVSELLTVLESIRGESTQTPPMFAAIKHKGKPLYEYARKGLTVERKDREITIYDTEMLSYEIPFHAEIRVHCSKGTYIRTLCHDIGNNLGCGAVMDSLLRTKIGRFSLEDSISLEDVRAMSDLQKRDLVLPMDDLLHEMKRIDVKPDSERILLNGNLLLQKNLINPDLTPADGDVIRIYLNDTFIAVGLVEEDGSIRPKKVLIQKS